MITDTRDRILEIVKKDGEMKPGKLSMELGIGRVALHRQIKKLLEMDLLEKVGNGPQSKYRLKSVLSDDVFKQVVWDYNLSPDEFSRILDGQLVLGSWDRSWATARILENMSYYEAQKVVDFKQLANIWGSVKPKLFNSSIRDGYEFVLYQNSLSSTK